MQLFLYQPKFQSVVKFLMFICLLWVQRGVNTELRLGMTDSYVNILH